MTEQQNLQCQRKTGARGQQSPFTKAAGVPGFFLRGNVALHRVQGRGFLAQREKLRPTLGNGPLPAHTGRRASRSTSHTPCVSVFGSLPEDLLETRVIFSFLTKRA